MAKTLAGQREKAAELFRLIADDLDEGENSDEWLDAFEEACGHVNNICELESKEEEE